MTDAPIPEVLLLRLPSRLELLAVLDRVALTVCERMDFDEDTSSQVSMSVIEAGTNAVQHGHHRDPGKSFEVEFRIFPDRLEVDVRDHGKGFDVGRLTPDVTSPDHLLDMRGRGIFIMRSCCDEVNFKFGPEGTVCHLVKHRPQVVSRAADA
ncbi:MAG TPA: ATP-binding protein [Candidatus Eisenbacteria bacterium]|nr:ATP-binding protein [Candidatus Eisenbacteria bacterium]